MTDSAGGFTLLEILVSVVIVSVLTTIITVGFRVSRDNQRIVLAKQELEALIRDTQKRAFNEEREERCLRSLPESALDRRRRCADVGIVLEGNRVTQFADTHGEIGDRFFTTGDYTVTTLPLASSQGVSIGEKTTLLFKGVPPTIELLVNGRVITAPVELVLRSGTATKTLLLHPYGQLEAK